MPLKPTKTRKVSMRSIAKSELVTEIEKRFEMYKKCAPDKSKQVTEEDIACAEAMFEKYNKR